jgi:5'-nucleotidase
LFPPYAIKTFEDIPVAFIGLTLKGTPNIVSPPGVAGLKFGDEVETVNALIPELKAKGVEAIVVLIHEGGVPTGDYNE